MAVHNPLIPTTLDVALAVACIVVLTVAVVALLSLASNSRKLSLPELVGWFFLIALIPVAGAIAWFRVRRNVQKRPGVHTRA